MARYIVLLAVLSLLLGGCVVVNLEEHVAAGVKTDAVPAALP